MVAVGNNRAVQTRLGPCVDIERPGGCKLGCKTVPDAGGRDKNIRVRSDNIS